MQSLSLSLYVHLPWCIRKCPYCDFNSHQLQRTIPERDYVAALLDDLKQDSALVAGRTVSSIFIGGGTPSLFSAAAVTDLLQGIARYVKLAPQIEITMEANPGASEEKSFMGFRKAGVNRLSLGVQSFQDDKLKILGRVHNAKRAMQAIEAAYQADFTNLNIDVMYGLPGQTLSDALFDLQQATYYQSSHISWYQLTIEPNTIFYKHRPHLPDEIMIEQIEQQGRTHLLESEFQQYEVSAYAKENQQCQHNLNYWLFGDYLGIGAGAHGKITDGQQIFRMRKMRQPKDYLDREKPYMAEKKIINQKQLALEFMLNALRLKQAIPWQLFSERTGLVKQDLASILTAAIEKKLISDDDKTFKTTALGQRYLNDLVELFL